MLQVLLFIWILHLMEFCNGQDHHANILRYKRSTLGRLCQPGCVACSALNGCLSCKPRLFFHLVADGVRQRGVCLSSCPRGHYGVRSPHISTCTRCREDCTSCFNKSFCTRCHPGHFLFRGRCRGSCPEGTAPNTALRECTECPSGCELCEQMDTCARCRPHLYLLQGQCHNTCPQDSEADVQLMQCSRPAGENLTCPQGSEADVQLVQCSPTTVHCVVGEWGHWGPCLRKGGSTHHPAYRRGEETRARGVLQPPGAHGDACPLVSEWRKCVVKKRPS